MGILIARDLQPVLEELEGALQPLHDELEELAQNLLLQRLTPQNVWEFERALQERLREAGRRVSEVLYNRLEPDEADEMPKQVACAGYGYSRKNGKTRNRQGVATLFGRIELFRFSYEPLREAREDGQRSFSPLEQALGLVAGNATPALAERVGRAAASHTQQELQDLLQREHGVTWSVKTLRAVTAAVSEGVGEHLHQAQKEQLLQWLRQAACKTVFTQRFKESGMSWSGDGGQTILTLRTATLSGVWETAYRKHLVDRPLSEVTTQHYALPRISAKAA